MIPCGPALVVPDLPAKWFVLGFDAIFRLPGPRLSYLKIAAGNGSNYGGSSLWGMAGVIAVILLISLVGAPRRFALSGQIPNFRDGERVARRNRLLLTVLCADRNTRAFFAGRFLSIEDSRG